MEKLKGNHSPAATVQVIENANNVQEHPKSIRNRFLFLGTFITTVVYIIWRVFFTIPFDYGIFALVCGIILLVVEMTGMLEAAEHFYSMSNILHPKKPVPPKEWYPNVDVFIATYNEPVELLRKTVNGCKRMDYVDKKKVHVYICDDGNRPEMQALADKMGIGYLTREEHKHAKAGNLNNAMEKTSSPLIATFDADMIPMHDFLMSSVPYFYVEDNTGKNSGQKEKIGFIQTPQSFYNPDLFQHNLFSENRIPDEQDYFYRDVQISRNKTNSVIYGGTNTVISREALNEVGGFCTGVITEDFATGMLIQSKGYQCYAIPDPHAIGQAPYDLKSLIKQRVRWARGCIQTGRKLNFFFMKGLSLKQKLSYLSSILYWYGPIKRFVYIMSPILFTVFNVVVIRCTLLEILIFWLPMYLFQIATLRFLSKGIRNTRWTNVYETILFPSLLVPVILESIGINKKVFSVTRKDGAGGDRIYGIIHAIPHVILVTLSLIGIASGIKWTFSSGSMTYTVLLFWLITNLYTLLMSTFFMLGRPVVRKAERFKAEIDCSLSWQEKCIKCQTYDISEKGLSIILDYPYYVPYDQQLQINLHTDLYSCTFAGTIVNVIQQGDSKWKYAITINHIEDEKKNDLYSLVYDRKPSLPSKLEKSISIFDDLTINVINRLNQSIDYNRKLARVHVNKKLNTKEAGVITLLNFNYEYALIKTKLRLSTAEKLTIDVSDDIMMYCTMEKDMTEVIKPNKKAKNSHFLYLYRINNKNDLIYNEPFKGFLKDWIEQAAADRYEEQRFKRARAKRIEFDDEFYVRHYL